MEPSTQVEASQSMVSHNEKVKWNDDFFNSLTLEECEKHFEEHYENNIDQFTDPKDKLSLLKSCIELLNRLENTEHNLFAGRVLIFLAKVIPFLDQSGVNVRSDFSNKEFPQIVLNNLQQISSKEVVPQKHDMEEGETISDEEDSDQTPPQDSSHADKIYEKFWKVQQFLNQPNLLYDKNSWFTFRTHVDTLVSIMENKQATLMLWDTTSYMTESRALYLQLNDINLRRCLLVQILIVLQYLELPVDMKQENFVLDKHQLGWTTATIKRAHLLLGEMPNRVEGRLFLNLVLHVLGREGMWNRWKNEKCKEPKKPEETDDIINIGGTYHKRRKISDELNLSKPYNMLVIGSQEMTRLWNTKPTQKFHTPDIVKYLDIPLEKQSDKFKDPNYSFRVLRLLRKSPHFFGPSSAVIQSLDGYLKAAATRYLNTNAEPTVIKPAESNNSVVEQQQQQPQQQSQPQPQQPQHQQE